MSKSHWSEMTLYTVLLNFALLVLWLLWLWLILMRYDSKPPTVTITAPTPVRFEATQEGRVDVAEYVVAQGKVGSTTVIEWRKDGPVAVNMPSHLLRFGERGGRRR